jgi:sulfatase modifying factor 1
VHGAHRRSLARPAPSSEKRYA